MLPDDVLAYIIAQAIQKLFQNDSELFEMNVHEVAINHRIAIYLEELLIPKDFEASKAIRSVDLEYNRVISDNILYSDNRKTKLTFEYHTLEGEIFLQERDVRPDIVVHQRCNSSHNILWMEVKTGSDIEMCRNDREKIYYACVQLGFETGVALLVDYSNKMLTIFMVSCKDRSATYEFNLSDDILLLKVEEKYGDKPEPRYFRGFLIQTDKKVRESFYENSDSFWVSELEVHNDD